MEKKGALLIGAHTSVAGGVHKALKIGEEIGATTIQIFTSNQKQWKGKPIAEDELQRWEEWKEKTGISHIMSHDSYLINLGSPKEEGLLKSRNAFKEELERCHQLNLSYLNFHPGAALDGSVETCLDTIVSSLLDVEELAAKGPTRLLLEATAGQGSNVGHAFEHLGYIIDKTKGRVPIGVCIDTCHIFAAGYDLRTAEDCDQTLKAFDEKVGLEHLYAFHFNDSMKPFASRRDRHAPLGEGEIGLEAFRFFMNDPRTAHLPKYLETPGGPERWVNEIKLLKEMVAK